MCYVLNLKWLGDLSIYKPGIRILSTQEKADSVSEISFACCQRKSGFIWVDKIWEEVVVWWVLSWSRRIHLAELRCGLADVSQDALWALDYISAKRGHFSPSLARQTSVRLGGSPRRCTLSDVFATHPKLVSKCLEPYLNGIHGPRGQVTHSDILLHRQKWQT